MSIEGAWIHEPVFWPDERGSFHEVFKLSAIKTQLGRDFTVQQVNQSVSSKGVIRGIHWTDSEEGQAKYISCPTGSLWDVVVDLRRNSSTYGKWDAAFLSPENRRSVLISEGLGHGFLSLEDGTIANYLCSTEFNPSADKTINALSATLAIDFEAVAEGFGISGFVISPKDSGAPLF